MIDMFCLIVCAKSNQWCTCSVIMLHAWVRRWKRNWNRESSVEHEFRLGRAAAAAGIRRRYGIGCHAFLLLLLLATATLVDVLWRHGTAWRQWRYGCTTWPTSLTRRAATSQTHSVHAQQHSLRQRQFANSKGLPICLKICRTYLYLFIYILEFGPKMGHMSWRLFIIL